jgi:hypothetical protein
MPTTGQRREDVLVEQFLSVYDNRSWALPLSEPDSPEKRMDSAVEMIATRRSDGLKIAIEHTLIEPFVGEKTDFHSHYKQLALALKADPSLMVPGTALYVIAPVNILPRRAGRNGVIAEVRAWLRENRDSFSSEPILRDCPSPSHPDGKVRLWVRLETFEGSEAFVIVERYGDANTQKAVRKALETKLDKLIAANVDRRLLLLERDQPRLYPEDICNEVERLRPEFPELDNIHEIWIVDTASFGDDRTYVAFERREGERITEAFSFYRGTLQSISKNGTPIAIED